MMQSTNKKKLKKADIDVLDRIIVEIHKIGKGKKTTISRNTNMDYSRFVLYLDYLELIDFVKRNHDEKGFEIIMLSEAGMNYCSRRLETKLTVKNVINKNFSQKRL